MRCLKEVPGVLELSHLSVGPLGKLEMHALDCRGQSRLANPEDRKSRGWWVSS